MAKFMVSRRIGRNANNSDISRMFEWLTHVWSVFLNLVANANPAYLFLAVAFLPLIGCPASPLLIAVGIRLGTATGMIFVGTAYLINFCAGYWMARSWFRAPLGRWLERRGQSLPKVAPADETQFILLVRITPGPPLFMQTYALGFAQVSFVRYLLLSMLIQMFYVYAFLSFGQSLNHNAVWRTILAVALLVGIALAVNLLRRWLIKRPPGATKT
jgi:uncharacterized membrane protein YdjX (TVP38/TMEM64 family)